MNLYQVTWDRQHHYVEAESFAQAIEIWHVEMSKDADGDWDGDEQPESVTLISDERVWRAAPTIGTAVDA